jgi:hypothetical protein
MNRVAMSLLWLIGRLTDFVAGDQAEQELRGLFTSQSGNDRKQLPPVNALALPAPANGLAKARKSNESRK